MGLIEMRPCYTPPYGLLVTVAPLPPVRQIASIASVVRDVFSSTSTFGKILPFRVYITLFLLGCATKYIYNKNCAVFMQHIFPPKNWCLSPFSVHLVLGHVNA